MADNVAAPIENAASTIPVVIKKYANRRLYNTETSSYITLENLADMIRAGRDFIVYDAKSSEDITRGVLTQIIVEEESKGTSMLPTNFLRQLIGFYGDSLQGVVPRYLESAMSNFARQQQQMRQMMQQTFSPFLPLGVEEIGRQNIAMMERAMSMFNPFHRPGEAMGTSPEMRESESTGVQQEPAQQLSGTPPSGQPAMTPEVEGLRREIENLRAQLAIARTEAVMAHAPIATATPAIPPLAQASGPASEEHISLTQPHPSSSPLPVALSAVRKVRMAKDKH